MRFMKMITTLFTFATATATMAVPSYAASVLSEILSGGVPKLAQPGTGTQ